jgi:hypothetical protein
MTTEAYFIQEQYKDEWYDFYGQVFDNDDTLLFTISYDFSGFLTQKQAQEYFDKITKMKNINYRIVKRVIIETDYPV